MSAAAKDEGRMCDTADHGAVLTQGLGVHYGEVRALTDVTVRIGSGEITGLVGVNGSGKSSMLAAVLGRVPHEGSVRILGRSPKEARRAGLVASVPQAEAVDWDFPVTVRDVVTTGRYGRMGLLRIPRAVDRTAVDEAIGLLGLTQLAGRQIGELSGGQRKRAFVARAIAQDAELLLLDEPFAGVDRTSEAAITDVLRSLRDRGRSVVIVHHDLSGVAELVDRVLLLQRGRLLHHGPPAETLTAERIAEAFGAGRPFAGEPGRPPAGEPGRSFAGEPGRTHPDRTDGQS
ncbi:manganese transport system ATP-binding protein [Agrococcus baldri]|uniref:Manganese transport system ATP-binding protein n=1 Tax=Agrococcus baldri TaxID=153730 RepID=A0AA94L075_9MICO|nr:metal ABC transporter ATP-binding protein [Agrococcus baldri]SFS15574.1 manganese transport system ATP-binding protein [Agrococcus baldri]